MMRGQNTSNLNNNIACYEQDSTAVKLFNPGAILVGECKLSCGSDCDAVWFYTLGV